MSAIWSGLVTPVACNAFRWSTFLAVSLGVAACNAFGSLTFRTRRLLRQVPLQKDCCKRKRVIQFILNLLSGAIACNAAGSATFFAGLSPRKLLWQVPLQEYLSKRGGLQLLEGPSGSKYWQRSQKRRPRQGIKIPIAASTHHHQCQQGWQMPCMRQGNRPEATAVQFFCRLSARALAGAC